MGVVINHVGIRQLQVEKVHVVIVVKQRARMPRASLELDRHAGRNSKRHQVVKCWVRLY